MSESGESLHIPLSGLRRVSFHSRLRRPRDPLLPHHCAPSRASPRYLPNIPPLTFDIQSTTHVDS